MRLIFGYPLLAKGLVLVPGAVLRKAFDEEKCLLISVPEQLLIRRHITAHHSLNGALRPVRDIYAFITMVHTGFFTNNRANSTEYY